MPLAVYNDDDLIGFVMIGKGTVGNENESVLIKENYCFWRFMIDKKYQGQGYGKKTIDAVMNLIRTFPFGEAKKYGCLTNRKMYTPKPFIKNMVLWRTEKCVVMK